MWLARDLKCICLLSDCVHTKTPLSVPCSVPLPKPVPVLCLRSRPLVLFTCISISSSPGFFSLASLLLHPLPAFLSFPLQNNSCWTALFWFSRTSLLQVALGLFLVRFSPSQLLWKCSYRGHSSVWGSVLRPHLTHPSVPEHTLLATLCSLGF